MNKISADIGNSFFGGAHFLQNLTGVGTLVSVLASNLIVIAGIVFVFLMIYAGFEMITGSGDVQKFERARYILTAAVIGLIIVIFAWFAVRIIEVSTGVNILS